MPVLTNNNSNKTKTRRRQLAQLGLVSVSLAHLLLCPHSKVEESFGLQAAHDFLYHGLGSVHHWDHVQYPGVVPRTFLPVGLFTLPLQVIVKMTGWSPLTLQFLVRLVQMIVTLEAWNGMAAAVSFHPNNNSTGTWLLIITACQFHLPFYSSRLLPNSWALIGTLYSFRYWLLHHQQEDSLQQQQSSHSSQPNKTLITRAAVCMVASATVVRCDLILLLFACGLSWLCMYPQSFTVSRAITIGITTGIVSLLFTVPLDSYLWNQWCWPEGQVLYYNTILNKSSDWGVSAWHWYWTSALPKALLGAFVLVPLSFVRLPEKIVEYSSWIGRRRAAATTAPTPSVSWIDTTYLPFTLPALGFAALYSLLGHKEVRFLFPALPLFNLAAAAGMTRLENLATEPIKDKRPTLVARIMYAAGIFLLVLSFVASSVFCGISQWNYPGGHALRLLVQQLTDETNHKATQLHSIRVHVDVASAMTGVSLFEQRAAPANWVFDKAGYEQEHLVDNPLEYTHRLSEEANLPGYHVLAVAPGHPRLDWRNGRIVTQDAIFVWERDGFGQETASSSPL